MLTRRQLLKAGALAGVGVALPVRWRWPSSAAAASGIFDPTAIPKYGTPLVIPPAMPMTSVLSENGQPVRYYEIGVRQFSQQILPAGLPATTVWSYGSVAHPGTFNYPAFTIEAEVGQPVRTKWINGLVDGQGNYLPHLLPVDPTLHWANPPGGQHGRDGRPSFGSTPGPYTGPVPIVTHLHGGHTSDESDGFAEAWYLPRARNIPHTFARVGSHYQPFRTKFQALHGQAWTPGDAVFQYDNDQPASTLWYHDHTLGMTRLNVYAGPAGFYLLRGGAFDTESGLLPGPAPALGDPPGTRYFEIPLAIQDRSFTTDGSLFYPDSRAFFDEFGGPYIPDSDVSPIWNPEFFGNTMLVNGKTWPALAVEPRRYRFRILNGCTGRFLILKLVTDALAARPVSAALPFRQIGAEGGFLPAPIELDRLLIAPAERADVIVDFSGLPIGTALYLINEGPDEPFGGGEPPGDFDTANPATTGQVMRFSVIPLTTTDTSAIPDQLPAPPRPGAPTFTRQVSLNELGSTHPGFDGPIAALLGTLNPDGTGNPLEWDAPITENVALGAVEIWEIYNFTEDAHPIHIHEVLLEVLAREPFGGAPRGPETWESGLKDTFIAYPGEVTRVKALYDRAGLYVWHCHLVEHEDNEMMRPYRIT
ncbi:MAG TPA: multicopper oxidase [Candidatus Limnocylindria bacterium]